MYVLGNIYTPSEKEALFAHGLVSRKELSSLSFELDLEKIHRIAHSLPLDKPVEKKTLQVVIQKATKFEKKIQRQMRLVIALSKPPVLVMDRNS